MLSLQSTTTRLQLSWFSPKLGSHHVDLHFMDFKVLRWTLSCHNLFFILDGRWGNTQCNFIFLLWFWTFSLVIYSVFVLFCSGLRNVNTYRCGWKRKIFKIMIKCPLSHTHTHAPTKKTSTQKTSKFTMVKYCKIFKVTLLSYCYCAVLILVFKFAHDCVLITKTTHRFCNMKVTLTAISLWLQSAAQVLFPKL